MSRAEAHQAIYDELAYLNNNQAVARTKALHQNFLNSIILVDSLDYYHSKSIFEMSPEEFLQFLTQAKSSLPASAYNKKYKSYLHIRDTFKYSIKDKRINGALELFAVAQMNDDILFDVNSFQLLEWTTTIKDTQLECLTSEQIFEQFRSHIKKLKSSNSVDDMAVLGILLMFWMLLVLAISYVFS